MFEKIFIKYKLFLEFLVVLWYYSKDKIRWSIEANGLPNKVFQNENDYSYNC